MRESAPKRVAVLSSDFVKRLIPLSRSGAGRFYYSLDPQGFRTAPLLRFGFNADPYLYPYYATIAPAGAGSARQVRGCASQKVDSLLILPPRERKLHSKTALKDSD